VAVLYLFNFTMHLYNYYLK